MLSVEYRTVTDELASGIGLDFFEIIVLHMSGTVVLLQCPSSYLLRRRDSKEDL